MGNKKHDKKDKGKFQKLTEIWKSSFFRYPVVPVSCLSLSCHSDGMLTEVRTYRLQAEEGTFLCQKRKLIKSCSSTT